MIPVFPVAETDLAASPSPSDVAQTLAQDPQSIRFKKLLIYCCTGVWESNPARLEAAQFCDLLDTLKSIAPTWQALQYCLARTAYRLNKSAEYTLVVHTLLSLLQPLYPKASLIPEVNPQIYEAIVQQLTGDPDLLRLKKLLILACTNQWESDRATLEQAPLLPLIQKLHALTRNRTNLCSLLENLVKTLSKAEEYRLLSDRLIQAFQPLYRDAHPTETPNVLAEMPQSFQTESLNANSNPNARLSPSTKFSTIAEATAALSALLSEQNKRSNSGSAPIAAQGLPAAAVSDLKLNHLKTHERFSLRQSVVQGSNPLRTKILLFSLLHEPFQFQQHEAMLKDQDLDELLQITFQTYQQVPDLKAALNQAASQLPNSQVYLQSAGTIVQAIQRFSFESTAVVMNPAPTAIVNRAAAEHATQVDLSQQTGLPHTTALTPDQTASLLRELTEAIGPETHLPRRGTAEQNYG